MCDEWEEDYVPYNHSQESKRHPQEITSPRSDRKRAFDSRGSNNRDREYSNSRDRQNSSRDYDNGRRERPPREFSRRDQGRDDQNSYDGPSDEFLIASVDVRNF